MTYNDKGNYPVDSARTLWKGENVGYAALHAWVKARILKPAECKDCGKKTSKLDCANTDHKYTRNLNSWAYLCHPCHMDFDAKYRKVTPYNLCNGCKFRPLIGRNKKFCSRVCRDLHIKEAKTHCKWGHVYAEYGSRTSKNNVCLQCRRNTKALKEAK